MKTKNTNSIMQNNFFRIALGTVCILLIPLLARWPWSLDDFIIMGALLFGTGSFFVSVVKATPRKYRVLIGIGFLVAFLITWVHLAVGIVDSWPFAGS